VALLVTKQNVAQKPTVLLLHELNDYVVNYIEHGVDEMQSVQKSLSCIETKALVHFSAFRATFSSNIWEQL